MHVRVEFALGLDLGQALPLEFFGFRNQYERDHVPQFGLAAALMYLPAKFEIRFLEPIDVSAYGPDDADDVALVQGIGEEVRSRIQAQLDDLLASRRSVWFG